MDRSFLGWMGYRYAFVCSDGPAHTMNAFWRLWRWSWDALMNGMFPASDYNNKPYAPLSPDGIRANTPLMPLGGGKYLRGMLFSSRADMDHNANTMHLSHHGSASPCTKCPSTTSTVNVPYNDFNYGRAPMGRTNIYTTHMADDEAKPRVRAVQIAVHELSQCVQRLATFETFGCR